MSLSVDFGKKMIVFVTGASKGIGRSIALELSRKLHHNSIFVLLARSMKGLEETKAQIQEVDKSITVQTYSVDFANPSLQEYEQLFEKVLSTIDTNDIHFGIFFHNAGSLGTLRNTTEFTDLSTWQSFFNLNLFSVSLLNSVFIKRMRSIAPQLVVVNVTSMAGRSPFVNLGMYGSGKASRDIFFKVLAVEEPKIIVLNYSPGPVDTDMFDNIVENAESDEVKNSFKNVRETTIVPVGQTVNKMLTILEKGDFKSGDTIDYFDRI